MSNSDINEDPLRGPRYLGSSNFVSGKSNQDRVQELVKKAQEEAAIIQKEKQESESADEETINTENEVNLENGNDSEAAVTKIEEVVIVSDDKADIEENVDSNKMESKEETPLIEEMVNGIEKELGENEKSETETEVLEPAKLSHVVSAEDIKDAPTKIVKPKQRRVAFLETYKGDEGSSERSYGTGELNELLTPSHRMLCNVHCRPGSILSKVVR